MSLQFSIIKAHVNIITKDEEEVEEVEADCKGLDINPKSNRSAPGELRVICIFRNLMKYKGKLNLLCCYS